MSDKIFDRERAADRIMALFTADDVVLRPSEIKRRTGLGVNTTYTTLQRLCARKKLFHLTHCQYSRCATTKPIAKMRSERISALERRVEQLETDVRRLKEIIHIYDQMPRGAQ